MITRAQLFLRDPENEAAATAPVLLLIERLVRDFPALEIGVARSGGKPGLALIDAAAWVSPRCDITAFDARMDVFDAEAGPLDLAGDVDEIARAAGEVLTRYQRFIKRRNTASRGAVFDRLFRLHQERALRDAPHRRRRYARALDVHHWTLRVEPHASLAVQAAALFLDVARLDAPAPGEEAEVLAQIWEDARIEPFVRDEATALVRLIADRESAAVYAVQRDREESSECLERVADAEPVPTSELAILYDADALSLFSLESADILDGYGLEVTEQRLGEALSCMTPRARELLSTLRLRNDVAKIVARLSRRSRRDRTGAEAPAVVARAS